MRSSFYSLAVLIAALLTLTLAETRVQDEPGFGKLKDVIESIANDSSDRIDASVWVGGPTGNPWYEWKASVPRPGASALKTALLIEFFARHAGSLDQSLWSSDRTLLDDARPAMALLSALQQFEVHQCLANPTPRQLARIMMGTEPSSNVVYNTAANLIIADLGGPEHVTELIHSRHPAFRGIRLQRYMLADRHPGSDNEGTATSLAAVLRCLAARNVPGVDGATIEAMRQVVLEEPDPLFGSLYSKDGDLYTDPIAVVRTGWLESDRGIIVYVVMTAQPNPGMHSCQIAYRRQRVLTEYLMLRAFDWGWKNGLPSRKEKDVPLRENQRG